MTDLVNASEKMLEKTVDVVSNTVEQTLGSTANKVGETVNNISARVAKTIDSTINLDELLGNKYLYAGLAIALAMYGPRLQPKLPVGIRNLFNNSIFRFAVIVLIMYLGNKNLQLSLILAIAFCLTMSLVNSQMAAEHFEDMVQENFINRTMTEGFYTKESTEPATEEPEPATEEPEPATEDTVDCVKCSEGCAVRDGKIVVKEAVEDKLAEHFIRGGTPMQQLSYLENSVREVTNKYKGQ